jgi:hypothetical protein
MGNESEREYQATFHTYGQESGLFHTHSFTTARRNTGQLIEVVATYKYMDGLSIQTFIL